MRRASALAARIGGRELREVARDALSLARGGLKRRARLDKVGRDETAISIRSTRSSPKDERPRYIGSNVSKGRGAGRWRRRSARP